MEKAHKIAADYLINYLSNIEEPFISDLTAYIASSKSSYRHDVYVLDIEEQILEIKKDVKNCIWYFQEFILWFDNKTYSSIFVEIPEDNNVTILNIDGNYLKCVYTNTEESLNLVEKIQNTYGKIDLEWFNSQIKDNFHSTASEVMNDIKNHMTIVVEDPTWEYMD